MNTYLLYADMVDGFHYPHVYDPIILDQIWDYTSDYTVYDMLNDPIKENSLFIIERNHLCEFVHDRYSTFTNDLKNCHNKKIIVFFHYKCMSAHRGKESLNLDKHILFERLGFQPKNIMYFVQLKSDIELVHSILGSEVKVTYHDKWLEETNRYLMRFTAVSKRKHIALDPNVSEKLFSLFVRRYEDTRFEVMCEFIVQDLLKDTHFTFAARGGWHPDNDIGKAIATYLNSLPERYLPYQDNIRKWAAGIPYEADTFGLNKTEIYDDLFKSPLASYYTNSKINIILETHFHLSDDKHSNFSIITEKTYKAIFYKKPFILISQPNALQILRDCGYKTFGHVINESYDKIETVPERLRAISNECLRIRNMNQQELTHLLDSCKEAIDHNYKLLLTESKRIIPAEYRIQNFVKS